MKTFDYGGVCKHIVALLLTYVHKPQAFRSIPPLSALLAGRSQKELIALIGELIKREPELLSLVELSVATEQATQGKPLDMAAYRRQTRRALRHESERTVEKELRALRELATHSAKAVRRVGEQQVELAPRPPLLFAVEADLPLALAVELDARRVHRQVQRAFTHRANGFLLTTLYREHIVWPVSCIGSGRVAFGHVSSQTSYSLLVSRPSQPIYTLPALIEIFSCGF